jgi:hypothetical protein
MKVTYEFNDDDADQLRLVQQVQQMYLSLIEIQYELRQWVKYNKMNLDGSQLDALDKFHERFFEIVKENNVNLEI